MMRVYYQPSTQSMAQQGRWNSAFDRDQIPDMEETVNDAFERFVRGVSHDSV